MPRELSARGALLLADLPPVLQDEPYFQAVIDSVGRELQRLEDFLWDLQGQRLPQNATDDYGILALFENLLGLSVAPPDMTVAERQTRALAHYRWRGNTSATAWVERMSEVLGTLWSHEEGPDPYQVTILVPAGPLANTQLAAARALWRLIGPAHIRLLTGTTTGFIIGSGTDDPEASLLGEDVI